MKLNIRKRGFLFICIVSIACDSSPKTQRGHCTVDPYIDKLTTLDVKLDEPKPGDWLSEHKEAGQSFSQYLKSKPVTPSEKQNKFYLQPIGKISESKEDVIKYTADYLKIYFDREAVILPIINDSFIPSSKRRLLDENNEQFKTGVIFDYLQKHISKDAFAIMAITSNDLYPDEAWNFVFGQARLKQRVGVSSLYRYCDSSIDSTEYDICLARMIKTSSHEMGHMLSCQHCTHAVCVMNGSNSLWESDSRPNRLCSECLRKLQWNLAFDVKTRLEKMKEYFAKHKLVDDYQMALKDLTIMGN